MTHDDLCAALLNLVAEAYPNVVYRRNVDRALNKHASDDQILIAIVYLRDSGLIEYHQALTKEYYYELTVTGWRKAFADNDEIRALGGHILDALAGRFPHRVFESRLLGSLQDLNLLFSANDYAKALGYLKLAGLVMQENANFKVNGSSVTLKLTPHGFDVQRVDCQATDDGVILSGEKAKE